MDNNKVKKKIVLFVWNFLWFLALTVLTTKYWGFKEHFNTWEEIIRYSSVFVIGSLGFAAWMTWSGVGGSLVDFFTEKRRKRNEKKQNNNENKKK